MGILKRGINGEDSQDPSEGLEEQYMRMFPKIGRDFVHKDDLRKLLTKLLLLVNPVLIEQYVAVDDSQARRRAREYKAMLDQNDLGTNVYKDLIKLDD